MGKCEPDPNALGGKDGAMEGTSFTGEILLEKFKNSRYSQTTLRIVPLIRKGGIHCKKRQEA